MQAVSIPCTTVGVLHSRLDNLSMLVYGLLYAQSSKHSCGHYPNTVVGEEAAHAYPVAALAKKKKRDHEQSTPDLRPNPKCAVGKGSATLRAEDSYRSGQNWSGSRYTRSSRPMARALAYMVDLSALFQSTRSPRNKSGEGRTRRLTLGGVSYACEKLRNGDSLPLGMRMPL